MNYMHKQGVCLHCTVAHCSLDYLKLYLFPQFYGTHSKMYTISLMIGPIRSKLALCRTLLEKPAYNQQYSVHAPSHEDPL